LKGRVPFLLGCSSCPSLGALSLSFAPCFLFPSSLHLKSVGERGMLLGLHGLLLSLTVSEVGIHIYRV
jgi:hypothetical protein